MVKILIIFVDVSKRIAFTAGVTSVSTWHSGTLVFPKVITNVGNGYNPIDGVFTAPLAGLYVFFVNVKGYTETIFAEIALNGAPKVMTMSHNNNGQSREAGPNLAVLYLQTGDRVWIQHAAGSGYISLPYCPITTFSGFLI